MANKNVIWCDPNNFLKAPSGNTYIITGANSGVVFETTKQRVKQGGHGAMATSIWRSRYRPGSSRISH